MPHTPSEIANLTAIAERLSRPDGPPRTVRILERGEGGPSFEILARDGEEDWPEEPREYDAIYVVISGEGFLRCGSEILECGCGDVLFAPAGDRRHFERLSRGFATWRIVLGKT